MLGTSSSAPGPILFIGDSITDWGRDQADPFSLGEGYVRLIADGLAAKQETRRVANLGISGDRARDLRGRWTRDVIGLAPSLLTVLVGINDTWRRYDSGDTTTVEAFERDYRFVLQATETELSAPVILMMPFLLPVTVEQRSWHEDLAPKQRVVSDLAAEFGAHLIDLPALLAAARSAEEIAEDGVHPSAEGRRLIAGAWFEAASAAGLPRNAGIAR
jgi:lysophospholipase L1-like esterase